MSLLNLAWHQPLLIPLMGEALPLREREGDGGGGGVGGGEGKERKRGRNAHVLVAREFWSREERSLEGASARVSWTEL